MKNSISQIKDDTGRRIELSEVVGKGGEGTIYKIKGDSTHVVKIYKHPLSSQKIDKIRTMVGLKGSQLPTQSAWPVGIAWHADGSGAVGLIMPRINGLKDIHLLYSPKSRAQEFQDHNNWKFLVRAAYNVANAIRVAHDAGVVIGDINHGGLLVSNRAEIKLIDCDSFQIRNGKGLYTCDVGVPDFTAPELQGKSFRGIERTANHDNFGLAVLIFQLLFMGRHPFAGKPIGCDSLSIPQAIKEFRFPYGQPPSQCRMHKPPGTPELGIVGKELSCYFIQAFSDPSKSSGRPTAKQWQAGLKSLEDNLKKCTRSDTHWHLSSVECPWCKIEDRSGYVLFPAPLGHNASFPTLAFPKLWDELRSLDPDFRLPAVSSPASAQTTRPDIKTRNHVENQVLIHRIVAILFLIGSVIFVIPTILLAITIPPLAGISGLATITCFITAIILFGTKNEQAEYEKLRQLAAHELKQCRDDWERKINEAKNSFRQKQQEALSLRDKIDRIDSTRASKLNQLERECRDYQLRAYLARIRIDNAHIAKVGPTRKLMLQSYGIETAAEVDERSIRNVPGFGDALTASILAWRKKLESKFRPSTGQASVDPQRLAAIEQEIRRQKQQVFDEGTKCLNDLKGMTHCASSLYGAANEAIQKATEKLAQAEANLKAARIS